MTRFGQGLRYLAWRAARAVIVVLMASFLSFVMLASSDFEYRAGLVNESIVERFFDWLWGVSQGDWGASVRTGEPVLEALATRFPVSLELLGLSVFLALALALPLAIVATIKPQSWVDSVIATSAFFFAAVPAFTLAVVLIFLFALELRWFPATGYERFGDDPLANLRAFTLPALTIALTEWAVAMRVFRADLLSCAKEDFVWMARAKGLPTRSIILKHMLRPSAFSLITVTGLQAGTLLGGVVLVEQLFALPGVGRLLFSALLERDLAVAQGCVVVIALGIALISLACDAVYDVLDPRVARQARD